MCKINERLNITLNGYKHYVSIKGNNIKNKIIISLHGGPGSPDSYLLYGLANGLADSYTIVSYDMRGCGRSYYLNRDRKNETLNFESLLKDLDELVAYLLDRFKKKSVIIMGHSFGSILGISYAKLNYRRVDCYIGVSQIIDSNKSLELNYNELLAMLDSDASIRLQELYNSYIMDKSIIKLNTLHKAILSYYKDNIDGLIKTDINLVIKKSPDYKHKDFRWLRLIMKPERYVALEAPILEYVKSFNIATIGNELRVPCYFIIGEHDKSSRPEVLNEYYSILKAPKKELVLLKNQGHTPQVVSPELFSKVVLELLGRQL